MGGLSPPGLNCQPLFPGHQVTRHTLERQKETQTYLWLENGKKNPKDWKGFIPSLSTYPNNWIKHYQCFTCILYTPHTQLLSCTSQIIWRNVQPEPAAEDCSGASASWAESHVAQACLKLTMQPVKIWTPDPPTPKVWDYIGCSRSPSQWSGVWIWPVSFTVVRSGPRALLTPQVLSPWAFSLLYHLSVSLCTLQH